MPGFCGPGRRVCGLQRSNVEIPLSVFLNTRVNNSAAPEQRLNVRASAGFSGVHCTFFPRPTRRNNDAGTSLSVRDWGFFCFLPSLQSRFFREETEPLLHSDLCLCSCSRLSPSWWPVGGATWQHISRRRGRGGQERWTTNKACVTTLSTFPTLHTLSARLHWIKEVSN